MDKRDVSDFIKSVEALTKKSKGGNEKVVFKEFELSLESGEDSSGSLGEFTKTLEIKGPFILAHEFVKSSDTKESTRIGTTMTPQEILNSTENMSPRPRKNSDDTSALEGSPLKLVAIADLSLISGPAVVAKANIVKIGPGYKPVTARRARYLLSLYSLACQQNKVIKTMCSALWVLCDGKKPGGIACLGVSTCSSSDKNQNFCSRGQRNTIVKLTGPRPKQSISSFHMENVTSGKHISCLAEYDVIGSLSKENPMAGLQGCMKLELKWDKTNTLLQTPPVDAETTAKVQVVPGDAKSVGYAFYSELCILKQLVEALTTGEICWAPRVETNSALDELKTLLVNLKLGDAKPIKSRKSSETSDLTTTSLQGQDELSLELERSDLDFTDMMWIVLKGCSSFSELVQCFQLMFAQLKSGELQPMVHKSNPTTVAALVRDCYAGRLVVPTVSKRLVAIELLADMGAEKLSHDYIHLFLSQDLTTLQNLDYFAAADQVPIVEKLVRLEKLHIVLELIIMLKTFLHSPQATLSTCARQMLQYYENNALDWTHVFQVSIPTLSIAKLLENALPCVWQLCLTKSVVGVDESSVYRLSIDPPFSYIDQPLAAGNLSDLTLDHEDDLEYFLVQVENNVTFL